MAMPFERLEAWKTSHALTVQLYHVTGSFPETEKYGREFRRYLSIAITSLNEVGNWLLLARDVGYLTPDQWRDLDGQRNHAGKLCWFLRRSLE
jgi:hypothetical protein